MSGKEEDRPRDFLFASTPSRESLDGAASFLQNSKPENISHFRCPSIEMLNNPSFNDVSDALSISPTEFPDIKSDSADPRVPSPSVHSVSSVASTQRLEWDSGADIGYGGLKSMFGLSTLERMAIGSCCSAFKQIEPKGECVLIKNDSNDHVQEKTENHHNLPKDSGIGNIEVEDSDTEMSSLTMHISKLDALDEAGNQIQEYQRHLALKEFEEDSMSLPKTKSERFDWHSDINTRIKALKIAEKRSSSMNDLSDPDGKKNSYLSKFKRIHSYSTIVGSHDKEPTNTMVSISPSCSPVSFNSSNTVIAPLYSNSFHVAKKNYSDHYEKGISFKSGGAKVAGMPKMSRNMISSDDLQQLDNNISASTHVPEVAAKVRCESAPICNNEVTQFVKNFVNKLCLNSGDARKQRLLKKILEDMDVLLQTDEEKEKLPDYQHYQQIDIDPQNKSASQQMSFCRNLIDVLPVAERKPCKSQDSTFNDVGHFGNGFQEQKCSSTDSRNGEFSVSATEYPYLSSSEKDSSTHWMGMQQFEDVESFTSRSSLDSPEGLSKELIYPHWCFVHSENQNMVLDRKTVPSNWRLFNNLKHMVTTQQERLELIKASVRQQRRRNVQRLQKDMLWLKHVERMLHTEQVNQANADSAKYRLQDVQIQCTLDEDRNNRESFMTKDSCPSSRCGSIFVCLPSTLASGIPAAGNNNPVKRLRSIGIQTSFTQNEPLIFEKEHFEPYSVDKPVTSILQTVTRKFDGCQDGKQTNSTESFNKVLGEQQPRPVAWFLPLNDAEVEMPCSRRKEVKTNSTHSVEFRYKTPLCERRKPQQTVQKAFQQLTHDKNLAANVQAKNCYEQMGVINPNLATNSNADLKEIQGGFRKYTVPVSFSSQHHNPKYRCLSHNDMQKQTKKIYNILPEITAKNEMKQRRDAYKTNRLMAQMFQKNLQQKVLSGRSSFITTEKCQC